MTDTFATHGAGLDSPASGGFAITNGTDFPATSRALYIGGAGNVVAVMKNGATLTFNAVPAGSVLPIRATQLTAATTATNVVGLF